MIYTSVTGRQDYPNQYADANKMAQTAGNNSIQPRAVLSAVARIGALNERLQKLRDNLSSVADQVGGPRPIGEVAKGQALPAAGVVGQLNESADYAHDYVDQIEDILACIGRSLG